MKPNKPFETYANRVAQFMKEEQLQADADTLRAKAGVGKTTRATDTQNPYLRARTKVLTDYPEWRRNEIQEMEKEMNLDNRFYNEFVKDVARLGDVFS
jgi:hypothetical protein